MKLIQKLEVEGYVWFWENDIGEIDSPVFETQDEALDWIDSYTTNEET